MILYNSCVVNDAPKVATDPKVLHIQIFALCGITQMNTKLCVFEELECSLPRNKIKATKLPWGLTDKKKPDNRLPPFIWLRFLFV